MSKWSGKCDVCDWFSGNSEEFISKSTIKIGETTLNIRNRKDLIPYYPYLVAMGGSDKEKCTVYLTKESYVDIEERESLNNDLRTLLDYYDAVYPDYDKEVAYNIIQPFGWKRRYSKDLVNRVAKFGHDATIDGLHDPTHERYRREFCEYLIKNDYDIETAYQMVYKDRANDKIEERKKKDAAKNQNKEAMAEA